MARHYFSLLLTNRLSYFLYNILKVTSFLSQSSIKSLATVAFFVVAITAVVAFSLWLRYKRQNPPATIIVCVGPIFMNQ